MMASPITAEELIHREAWLLDAQDFDGWLDLFAEDCIYWAPALRDDGTYTSDPTRELSLIYYKGKDYLRDRVARLRSGTSIVSRPLPRVVHSIGRVFVEVGGQDQVTARASFVTHVFSPRTDSTSTHFGQYEHRLEYGEGTWMIAEKKVFLANDLIPTVLDINAL